MTIEEVTARAHMMDQLEFPIEEPMPVSAAEFGELCKEFNRSQLAFPSAPKFMGRRLEVVTPK